MNCVNCKYVVGPDMRFALMKNMCPACGSNLFSKKEMNDISMLQNRITNQEFSDDLGEVEIFDVALFMFNEFKGGIGQVLIQREIDRIKNSTIKEGDDTDAENTEPVEFSENEEDIREQVRQEVKKEKKSRILPIEVPDDDLPENFSLRPENEGMQDRVKRLKRIAKGNSFNTGTMVKRVD